MKLIKKAALNKRRVFAVILGIGLKERHYLGNDALLQLSVTLKRNNTI